MNCLGAVLAAATFTVIAACDTPVSEDPIDPSPDKQQLTENRQRFRANVGTNYRYDYRNVCFCGPDSRLEVRVTVRDRARVSVVATEGDEPIPRERWRDYLTVEEAFDTIEQALDDGAASVRVVYDEALGYPKDAFIDFDERIADEERGFTFDNVIAIP